jgi:hypothetical protein
MLFVKVFPCVLLILLAGSEGSLINDFFNSASNFWPKTRGEKIRKLSEKL